MMPLDYGVKERKPSFNGGDANEFSKWVYEHKIYPEEAKKAGIEGRVYTRFTITKEGKLTNVKLLRGVHPLLDEEAIRVIKSAPQIWKPGLNYKGEPIDVNYTFPVLFSLPKE
jgi:protein TonB